MQTRTQTKINWEAIRENHPLEDVISGYIGQPVAKNTWYCPFHNDTNNPNLKIGRDGISWRCWSASCGKHGDVVDFVQTIEKLNGPIEAIEILTGEQPFIPWEELGQKAIERKAARQAKEQEQVTSALERVGAMLPRVAHYQSLLDTVLLTQAQAHNTPLKTARDYFHGQGLTDETIAKFKLGGTTNCPSYYNKKEPSETIPSYTIPYFHYGELVSIRHRLAWEPNTGKYRPEFSGLPTQLFNPDGLHKGDVVDESGFSESLNEPGEAILVEGEIKAMVLDQVGFSVAGIPGAGTWKTEWLQFFQHLSKIYIVLDPGVKDEIWDKILTDFKGANIHPVKVSVPCKPDDFFIHFGGTVGGFYRYLKLGRIQ